MSQLIRYGRHALAGFLPVPGSTQAISYRGKGGVSPLDPDTTLFYDFSVTRDLVDEINGIVLTFTRSSIGWSYDAAGLLVENAINAPRFDYDPITLVSLGLLMEEARTNLCLWSRTFTQAAWIKTDITPVKDQVGVDGVAASATRLTADAPNGTVVQTVTAVNASYATSIFVRRLTGSGVIEGTVDGTNWLPMVLTNNFQRFDFVASVTNPAVGIRMANSGDEIAVDVAQLESGVNASSPIITAASTITRALDVVLNNTDIAAIYNDSEGTLYARMIAHKTATGFSGTFSDGTGNNRTAMVFRNTLQSQMSVINAAGNNATVSSDGLYTVGTSFKMAGAYEFNRANTALDGLLALTEDTLVDPPPGMNTFRINNRGDGSGSAASFHLAVFAYANVSKDNAFLQSVTLP